MKPNRWNRFLAALRHRSLASPLVVVISGLSALPASSATLTWDVSPGTVGGGNGFVTGGPGNWDTTATLGNWTTDGGVTNVAWTNTAPPNSAIFEGTGGTVTQNGVTVNGITFNSTGYTIAANTLTLGGTTPTLTANADAAISSILAGTAGMTKAGGGVLGLSTKATYTGGTTVNAGVLSLNGGGGSEGTIRGTATVNSGATLRLNSGDVTGYGTSNQLTTINVNGGTLNVAVTNNQTLGNCVINLTGAAITGVSGSNLDFFQTASGLNSLASATPSTVTNTRLTIRQTAGLTLNVADGTAPIDLDVNSVIATSGTTTFATAPLIKAGAGTLRLNAANTYTGATTINGGTFILSASATAPSTDVTVNSGGTLRVANTGKTLKSLAITNGTTLAIAAKKTASTTVTNALNANGAITVKPEFIDVPAPGDVYTLATGASTTGTPVFTVDTGSFGATRVAATAAMAGSALQLTVGTGGANLVWNNNAATGTWNHNTDANFDNAGSPDVFKSFDGVTFDNTATGTITLDGNLYPGTVTVSGSTGNNHTFTGSGAIASGSLIKAGTGILTVNNANSPTATTVQDGFLNANVAGAVGNSATAVSVAGGFLNANVAGSVAVGSIAVSGGTLNIGNATGLGNSPLVLTGGTLDNLTGGPLSVGNGQTWNGSFAFTGTQDLTSTGTIALTGNSQVAVNANTWTANGVISGAFGLTKSGAGTLRFGAANTFSGPTTVNGGRLWVSNTLRNSSALNVGPGATLELGATNIFVGGHGTALPDAKVITVDGGTLLFNASLDTRFGSVTLNNGATWTSNRVLTNYDGLLGNVVSGPATVSVGGTGMSLMNGSGGIHLQGVQNFAVADTSGDAGDDLRVNMVLAGPGTTGGAAGGVNKTGPGTLALNAVNTYTGATTVTGGGTLRLGTAGTIASSDVTLTGSTLQTDSLGKSFNSLTVNGPSTLATAARKGTPSISLTGALTTTGAITLRPNFEDTPLSGDVYDIVSAGSFTDGGTYAVDMSARGATRVTATAAADLGQYLVLTIGTGAADLTWNNNAATGVWNHNVDANFDNAGSPDVFKSYDAVNFGDTAAGTVTLAGTLYPGTVTVDSTAAYTFTGSGSLGGGSLVKDGSSTLTVANANSPSSTTLNAGTLSLANAAAIGTTGSLAINGGVLHNGTGGPLTLAHVQAWGGAFATTGDALTTSGPVTIGTDSEITVGTGGLTATGGISGAKLTKKGTGTLALAGTNSNLATGLDVAAGDVTVNTGTGIATLQVGGSGNAASFSADSNQTANRLAALANVTIGNQGTVNLHGVNAIPNHANSCHFTVETGGQLNVVSGGSTAITATGTSHVHLGNLILNGGTVSLPYSGGGTSYNGESFQLNGTVTVGGTSPSTIAYGTGATAEFCGVALDDLPITFTVADVTGDGAADLTIDAELENSDTGSGSLVKEGPGTLMLAGGIAHSYSGSTTVNAGTLAGTGSLAGPLVVAAGGTVAPGASAGSLGTGDLTLQGTYACEIGGATGDALNVTGNLDLTGATLALTGTPTAGTYIIATWTGTRTADFATVTGLPSGYSVVYDDAQQRILVTDGSADPYADWETANGIAGAGPDVDSDGDGLDNGLEFALGGDPSGPGSSSTALLPTLTDLGNNIRFSFHLTDAAQGMAPAIWSVEFDDDLAGTWTTAADPGNATITLTADGTSPETGAPWQRVEVTLPKSTARNFVRLKVDLP